MKNSRAVISCKVTGLTKKLDNVKWTRDDNSLITSGGEDGFIIDTGSTSFSGNTQTTTLTVPASQTDQDRNYNCLITSNEHDATDKTTTLNLKVVSK